MELKRSDRGVTLIALVTTIVILLIIAGISIYSGTGSVKRVKLEALKTNMLLIEAKAREYVEEANFKIGKSLDETEKETIREEVYENGAQLKKAEDAKTDGELESVPQDLNIAGCYVVTKNTLKLWKLDKIELDTEENEQYLVKFDESNLEVEVYNTKGYEGAYSLTDIENKN